MTRDADDVSMSAHAVRGSIVVGVDGSDHAERALHWAAEQASLEHRLLIAVTAGADSGSIADNAIDLARRLYPGLSAEALSAPGDPRGALLELSTQAHMLVMGSRGRGPWTSLLLGSVSTAVSGHSVCPVVVCRPKADRDQGRGVLLGADTTPESTPVIEFAFEQASLRKLPLTVLHVYWDAVEVAAGLRHNRGWVVVKADLEDLRALLSEAVAGLGARFPDVSVTLTLKNGLVDEVLVRSGDSWDLIVVGRHPMDSIGRVISGSIATTVVELANTTVAVVPEVAPS